MTTCRLRVGGTIDLDEAFPIVGGAATLSGELLTGVGDSNHDKIRDRMIRFDREGFLAAIAGQTGDITGVLWGGLLPDGTPRFLAPVIVSVFARPK